MQGFWPEIQRYSRHIAIVPTLLLVAFALLTGRTVWIGISAVWFLGVIAVETAAVTFISVRRKLPRRKRDALATFLQMGGYTLAAASMGAYFALAFWTSYRPGWLMGLMFGGILMCFFSGLVYKGRSRKSVPKAN